MLLGVASLVTEFLDTPLLCCTGRSSTAASPPETCYLRSGPPFLGGLSPDTPFRVPAADNIRSPGTSDVLAGTLLYETFGSLLNLILSFLRRALEELGEGAHRGGVAQDFARRTRGSELKRGPRPRTQDPAWRCRCSGPDAPLLRA